MATLDAFLRPVRDVAPDTSAAEAARILRDESIGALVVVDGDARAIGIVTDRDLALRIVGARLDPKTTPVSACMSSPLVTLGPEDTDVEATRKMRERLVRRLPIVDVERRVIGMVTADDLVQAFGTTVGLLAGAHGQNVEGEARLQRPDPTFGKE